MYRQRINHFTYKTKDERIIQLFEDEMLKNFKEVFTDVEKFNTVMSVNDSEARSAITGKYSKDLEKLKNSISRRNTNNAVMKDTHQMAIFSVLLNGTKTFTKFMNKVRLYIKLLEEENYNWNKVFYGYYEKEFFV